MDLIPGLHLWFTHAFAELRLGETEDPAGVAEKPIKLNVTRTKAVQLLQDAPDRLTQARTYEEQGYLVLAHDCLAKLFNDPEMLPRPNQADVLVEAAAHRREHVAPRKRPDAAIGTNGPARRTAPSVRSWAP